MEERERGERRIKTRRETKAEPSDFFLSVFQQGLNNLTEQAALVPHLERGVGTSEG